MNRPNQKRRLHLKRAIATALAVIYLGSTEGPMFLAIAAPQVFVRPGAGVSRLPLEVAAFGAPGFGDVQDAINLASGNVFVDAGGASRNNLLGAGGAPDETQNTIGGGNWNLTPRLRLGGFDKSWGNTNVSGVTASANPTSVGQSGTSSLTATVTGSSNTAVTWSIVSPAAYGSLNPTTSTTGAVIYTAPASVTTQTVVTLKATSQADPSKTVNVTVTVNPPLAISMTPATNPTIASSGQQALSATVTGSGTFNANVNWSLQSGAGAISSTTGSSITYRAPCVTTGTNTAVVRASAAGDASKFVDRTITISAETGSPRVSCGSDLGSSPWNKPTALTVNRFAVADTTGEDSDGALDTFSVNDGSSYNYVERSPVTIADGERVTVSLVASGSGSINYTVRPDSCNTATENCEPYDLNNSGARGTNATPDWGDYSYITLTSTPTKYTTTFTKASDGKPAKLVIGGINPGATVNLGGAKIVLASAAPTITAVTVASSATSLPQGGAITLTPTVTGTGAFSSALNWSVSPSTAGSFSSANPVTGAVNFTASASATLGSITLTATSVQDGTKSGTKAVTVTAPTVTAVSVAANTTTVSPSGTVTLTPTVTGTGSFSQTVNWTVSPTTAGTFSATSSSAPVTFTAASTVTNGATITVTAKSAQDATKLGTSTLTVSTAVAVTGVSLVSSNTQIGAEGSVTLTPTLTGTGAYNAALNWTVSPTTAGTFSSANPVTGAVAFYASSTLAAGTSVTVTATSVQTPAKTASVALTSHAKVLGSQSALTSNPPWVRQNVLGFTANALAVSTLLDKDGFLDNFTTTSYGYLQTPLTVPSGQTVRVSFVGQSTNSATVNFDLRNGTSGAVLTGTDALSATRTVTLSSTATRSVNLCYANTTGIGVDLIIAGIDSTTEVIRLGGVRAELVSSCTVGGNLNAVKPVIQARVQPNKAKAGISRTKSNWISRLGAQATLVNGGVQGSWFSKTTTLNASGSSAKLVWPKLPPAVKAKSLNPRPPFGSALVAYPKRPRDSASSLKRDRASKKPSSRGREVNLVDTNSVSGLPSNLTLFQGDGSGVNFSKKAMTATDWTNAPSWIKRYQTTTDSGNIVLYALQTQVGVQYSAGWIVVRVRDANRTVAHYYDASGTRHSFFSDGEYEDYTQNLSQQYRGAGWNDDPEGESLTACATTTQIVPASSCTPKTEIVYTAPGSGRILKVRDEWGRVTVYAWNIPSSGALSDGTDGTLNSIYYLVTDENNAGGTYARRATFEYATYGTIRAVSAVTYAAANGLSGTQASTEVLRRFEFQYATQPTSGKLVMTKLRRPVKGGAFKESVYAYDSHDAVSSVTSTGEPALTYDYHWGGGVVPSLGGTLPSSGTFVTVTQGTDANQKVTESIFDAQKQLVEKDVKDFNPNNTVTRTLSWKYTYYPAGNLNAGSVASVTSPSKRKDDYTYDANGNVILKNVSDCSGACSLYRTDVSRVFDADNRLTLDRRPGTGGTLSVAGVSVNYANLDRSLEYQPNGAVFTHGASGQAFTLTLKVKTTTSLGATPQYLDVDTLDLLGRLTASSHQSGAGAVLRATGYGYHTGENWAQYFPNANGGCACTGANAKQFADQVLTSDDGRGLQRYYYDVFGHTNWQQGLPFMGTSKDGNTAQMQDKFIFRSFNGFGQQVWETAYEHKQGDTAEADPAVGYTGRTMWYYSPSGELTSSWVGDPTNTTEYRYDTTAGNFTLGKLLAVVKGAGDGLTVPSAGQHEITEFTYDPVYGRKASEKMDGISESNRTFTYDTLDRLVITNRNSLPEHGIGYGLSGLPEVDANYNGGTSIYNATFLDRDVLGRVTATTIQGIHPTNPTTARTIWTSYDPYDRPIKVTDNRLTTNTAGDDQASFIKYDEFGRVLQQIGPKMRTAAGAGRTDNRRPYVSSTYDNFGRLISKAVELSGEVSTPASFPGFPDLTRVAYTTSSYDAYDRPSVVTDPDGYTTSLGYDNAGNVTSKTQQVCASGVTACGVRTDAGADLTSITTSTAYDALGRAVRAVDGRGNASRVKYNALGLKVAEMDARGVTVKGYTYTGDGLLSSVLEPDNNANTTATAITDGNWGGYITTKVLNYGTGANSRKFPTSQCVATMNTQAPTGACTTYTSRDWAGRPTATTLPDNTTITQSYDPRGNQTSIKDAEGFVTNSSFDAFDRLIGEVKPPRATDVGTDKPFASGFTGLTSSYQYDELGNLYRKVERGLTTDYAYDSLGKAIVETRPYSSCTSGGNGCAGYKLKAYRLDGELLAESSYNYGGGYFDGSTTANWGNGTIPSVPSGNISGYVLSTAGKRTREWSHGTSSTGTYADITEFDASHTYNGLGLRVSRAFSGSSALYMQWIRSDNTLTNSSSADSFWRYDANGNLIRKWDKATGDTGEQNVFAYTYSNSGKRTSEWRSQIARAKSGRPGSTQALGVAVTGIDTSSFAYNERDQLLRSAVTDISVAAQTGRTTIYNYFGDGSKAGVNVYNGNYPSAGTEANLVGSQSFNYDSRGRLTSNYDSNGFGTNGAVTVTTAYSTDGTVTRSWSNYSETTTPTVGGLTATTSTSTVSATGCSSTGCTNSSRTVYNANGQPTSVISTDNSSVAPCSEASPSGASTTTTTNITQDAFGNITGQSGSYTGVQFICLRASVPISGTAGSVTTTYDANNASKTKTTDSATTTYALDSRGNRLSASTTVTNQSGYAATTTDNGQKRYDPDGRVAEFTLPGQSVAADPANGVPFASYKSNYLFFRYNPDGVQTLASSTQTVEYVGTDTNGITDPSGTTSKTYAVVEADGQTEMIDQVYQNTGYGIGSVCKPGKNGEEYCSTYFAPSTTPLSLKTRDETFSLVDGVLDVGQTWDILKPFNARPPRTGPGGLPLSAPTKPLSATVRVDPLTVTAPGVNTPKVGDPTKIAPPVEPPTKTTSTTSSTPSDTSFSSTTALANDTSVTAKDQPVSSPSVGVSAFSVTSPNTKPVSSTPSSSVTAPGTPSSTPISTPAQTPSSTPFSSQTALQAPSSVLPTAISRVTTQAVQAPTSATIPSVDPTKVAPPTSSLPPSTTTPKVTPPSTSVPKVGNPVSVTPPKTDADTTVKPQGISKVYCDTAQQCTDSISQPGNLDSKAAIDQQQAAALVGEMETRARQAAVNKLAEAYWKTHRFGSSSAALAQAQKDVDALDGFMHDAGYSERDRIYGYTGLAAGLASGDVTLEEWKDALKEMCGMRSTAAQGPIGTCDKAHVEYKIGSPFNFNPVGPLSFGLRQPAPGKFSHSQGKQFLSWLYGYYDFENHHPVDNEYAHRGQLSRKNVSSITNGLEVAFESIKNACVRGNSNTHTSPQAGLIFTASAEAGFLFSIGGSATLLYSPSYGGTPSVSSEFTNDPSLPNTKVLTFGIGAGISAGSYVSNYDPNQGMKGNSLQIGVNLPFVSISGGSSDRGDYSTYITVGPTFKADVVIISTEATDCKL